MFAMLSTATSAISQTLEKEALERRQSGCGRPLLEAVTEAVTEV